LILMMILNKLDHHVHPALRMQCSSDKPRHRINTHEARTAAMTGCIAATHVQVEGQVWAEPNPLDFLHEQHSAVAATVGLGSERPNASAAMLLQQADSDRSSSIHAKPLIS